MIIVADTSPINYLLLIGQAASQGLIGLEGAINQLKQTNFRISRRIIEALLESKG